MVPQLCGGVRKVDRWHSYKFSLCGCSSKSGESLSLVLLSVAYICIAAFVFIAGLQACLGSWSCHCKIVHLSRYYCRNLLWQGGMCICCVSYNYMQPVAALHFCYLFETVTLEVESQSSHNILFHMLVRAFSLHSAEHSYKPMFVCQPITLHWSAQHLHRCQLMIFWFAWRKPWQTGEHMVLCTASLAHTSLQWVLMIHLAIPTQTSAVITALASRSDITLQTDVSNDDSRCKGLSRSVT